MLDLGIVRPGQTIYLPFDTFDGGTGASITMTGLAVGDIQIYKDGSMTQRASTSGFTLVDTDGTDIDSITGLHAVSIDLADNTTAGFYTAGSRYMVAISTVTVDGQTLSFWLARFVIGYPDAIINTTIATLSTQTSFTLTSGPAEANALVGCPVVIHDIASAVQLAYGIITAYAATTKTVTLLTGPTFTVAAGDNISVYLPSNSRWIGAALPANATIGTVTTATNVTTVNGLAANVVTAAAIAADAIGASELAADAASEIATATWAAATRQLTGTQTFNLTGDITGNLSGSVGSVTGAVGSVTGAVGSVTGNVGGNVTGSVGSVVGHTVQTGDSFARIGATGSGLTSLASASALSTAQADLDTLTGTDGATLATSQPNYAPATAAQVNAEVVDALATDTYAEPTGVPGATVTLATKLGYLYMALRNRIDVTSTKKTFYDDTDAAEWEKDLSDNGTTYSESEGNAI